MWIGTALDAAVHPSRNLSQILERGEAVPAQKWSLEHPNRPVILPPPSCRHIEMTKSLLDGGAGTLWYVDEDAAVSV
jgi:hypothetical protein